MEDISIQIGQFKLNLRVGAIIIHKGKVLLHKCPTEPYYAIIGGRLKIGEDTKTAVKREVKEELGKDIEIMEELGIIENFFAANDAKYHEILFLYKAEFIDGEDKNIIEKLETIEEQKETIYEWIDINALENIDLRPRKAKELLQNTGSKFLVNNELNNNN